MVRYLILNTPKVLEYIQGKPVSTQTNLLFKLLAYGASNGERKNNYDPDLDELLTFVSFGDVIPDDTTAKDRFLKDCFEKKKREAVAALGRGDGVTFNNIISRMTKDQASEVIEEYAKVKAHNEQVGRV